MARTRASTARLTDQPARANRASPEPTPPVDDTPSGPDTPAHERRDITPSASTFNGRLQQFHYPGSEPTSPGKTASPQSRSSTHALKRVRSSPGLATGPGPVATQSPAKRRRASAKYAPPSKYAHLSPLTDILEPGLICVFVGFNPGVRTATAGHAYAHPSNLFWKLLHASGLTDRLCRPEEDVDLPRLYAMGNTNLVARPSRNEAELSKHEQAAATPILEAKIREFKPEAVCIVGKGIWESIWRWRRGRNPSKAEFKYGWQDESENIGRIPDAGPAPHHHGDVWQGARVYVATATSGLAASTTPVEKEAIWRPFGQWVQQRRRERSTAAAAAPSSSST